MNPADFDTDGDLIPNPADPDIDNDGLNNWEDDDIDGDGEYDNCGDPYTDINNNGYCDYNEITCDLEDVECIFNCNGDDDSPEGYDPSCQSNCNDFPLNPQDTDTLATASIYLSLIHN